ncbi:hypothetical protein FRC01_000265 [Tulasnella sp. 417]|nr:hypothetical protein FRC01_000265 [Tulasnella sp. 417]
MQRMMQASGTSEGLRTLIDSSLPASVKKIMANRATFGPAIFAIAINLMSIFVHNEPTSLSILQEAHIPETFYDAIENGIEPALEVITALPNAIGALCLNPAGEAQFAARTKIIPAIFETFTSDKHIKVLGEKENAIVIGTALDELIRHHPTLKPQIFEGVQAMLQRIEDIGKTWTPPKGEEPAYLLRSPVQDAETSEKMDVEPSSSTAPPPQTRGPEDEAVDEDLKEEGVIRPENNLVLSFLDVAAKVLEGIFQYAPHCRDFIVKYDGIERLGRCLQLSALPVRFSETPAADSLIQIFRTMAELNSKETLAKLSVLVRNALDESKDYWETMSAGSKLAPFTNITAESDLTSLNANFRKLVAFQIVVGITGDVYQSLGFSHAPIAKLFMTSRRIADSTSKSFSNAMAKNLANILLEHCKWGTPDDLKSNFAYSTLVISFITMLFRDDRSPQVHLHTLLLVMFTRAGGVEAIVSLGQRAADLVSKVASSSDKGTDDEAAVAYAYGLLNVVVHLLGVLVAARPLLESSQTVPLITRDKDARHPEYFEPHAFIVRMRHRVLPFLRGLWQSTWLANAPLPVVKSILSAIVEIMAADHEDAPSEATPEATIPSIQQLQAQLRPNNTPDEAAVTQLVDMGFSRANVERALMRSRNNVNAAAELLINHPHLFPAVPPVTSDAAPAPPQDPNTAPVPEPAPAANAAEGDATEPPPAEGVEVAMAVNEPMDATPSVSDAANAAGLGAETESAPSPDDGTPERSADDQAVQTASGENEETAIVLEPERNWKEELDETRAEFRNQIISRAFSLTDTQPALVFEVKTAFVRLGKSQQERELLSVLQVDPNATSEILAARCRLLALILNDPAFPILQVSSSELQEVMNSVITTLRRLPDVDKLSAATIPSWLAPYLLVAEALISLGDSITEVEVPTPEQDVPTAELQSGTRFADERQFVFDLCLGLLKLRDLARDEMLAVLRLLALLTKEYSIGAAFVDRAGPSLLLDHFKGSNKDALTYRSLGFTIIRHATEDASIVEGLMKHHLKRFFALSRNRLTDVGSMVKSTSPLALRDPATYISACKTTCRLATLRPGSSTYTISLDADTKQPESQEKTDAMQVDASSKADPKLAEVIIHYVMSELLKVAKSPTSVQPSGTTEPAQAQSQLPAKEGGGSSSGQLEGSKPYEETGEYAYTCILMQLLAELLSSYDSCKVAFVSFHKRRSSGVREGTSKSRPAFLGFLLTEILAAHTGLPKEDPLKKPSLSSWATSIIVALCSDIYTTGNVKDASDELTAARKFVLDALAKAMKEVGSGETPDVRYGRLYGLAELCYRLLSFRSPSPSGGKEETNIHIAKIMLEKNFVATLTAALAEADLNYPGMKSLISAIMRPLEHL